ncbi:MAG: hypothetical protein L0332_32115, partial [Chloroflexi bacterium]|nr:hypothetical protein [Chloroflexota bacterium]
GVALGVALGVAYFRLFPFFCQLPYQWLLARSGRGRPGEALATLPRSPVFWDELVWLPLAGLDAHLVAAAQADRAAAARAIGQVAASFRQGWAARRALLEITARDLEQANSLAGIAGVAETLAWLPPDLPAGLENALPALRQVAERVRAAEESEEDANRLDQLERAQAEVIQLQQAQAWAAGQAGARLAAALLTWRRLLDQALADLRRRSAELPVPNYYVVGNPLADKSRVFKGRRDLFLMLERELAAQPEARPTLLLYGPRRSGKTSVLRQLPSRLGPDFVPVEVDLQSAITGESAAGLLGSLARQVQNSALHSRRLKLPPLSREWLADDPYTAFFDWAGQLPPLLDGRLILLNLDEYERLEEMIAAGRLDERVFHWLRGLIQHHPHLVILLAGSHTAEELPSRWGDALVNVRLLPIGPLQPGEARELITAPVPDFPLHYEPEAVEAILAASGGQPYLVQAICRDLVNHVNENHQRQATLADVTTALNTTLQTTAAYFTEWWTSRDTDDAQRAVARLLARARLEPLSESELLGQAQATPAALRGLLWRQVVEEANGGYRLRAGLAARWINERAPA